MKQIICKKCMKKWYVDNGEENLVMTCPFCSASAREEQSITEVDTLAKAIFKAVYEHGTEMLTSLGRISGYLFDMVPDLKKEIRIFSKAFNNDYIALFREAFDLDIDSVKLIMKKFRRFFIEEEGLSDYWADLLCENCFQAIIYFKGKGLPEKLFIEVSEIDGESSIKNNTSGIAKEKKTISKGANPNRDELRHFEQYVSHINDVRKMKISKDNWDDYYVGDNFLAEFEKELEAEIRG